jgi:homoserine dehydrogenase
VNLTLGIGLLACGTVGAQVADRLQRQHHALQHRAGVQYELRTIAIRDPQKSRPPSLDPRLFTGDGAAVVDNPHVDVLIECIARTTDAGEFVERALHRGRHVISANKDRIAAQGPRLRALAGVRGVTLRFQAAVGGAIPVVRALNEALTGDEATSVAGVASGTCTSILSRMGEGAAYADALSEAPRVGFAEADPSSDVDGVDAHTSSRCSSSSLSGSP